MASIIEKNIQDLLSGLHHGLGVSLYSEKKGVLQALDPRTKIFLSLLLIIYANSSQSLFFLLALYCLCLMLCGRSAIPIRSIAKIWAVLPFFSLVFALPMIFSFVTPGIPLLAIPGFHTLSITLEGVLAASRFLLRVATSVTIIQMLLATTPWNKILSALRFFRVPASLIFILALTYRYIFVLVLSALDMMQARKSRGVGRVNGQAIRSWFGALIGTLMMKSFVLSREVNDAMVSRGFMGQVRTLNNFSFQLIDYFGCIIATLIGIMCVAMRYVL